MEKIQDWELTDRNGYEFKDKINTVFNYVNRHIWLQPQKATTALQVNQKSKIATINLSDTDQIATINLSVSSSINNASFVGAFGFIDAEYSINCYYDNIVLNQINGYIEQQIVVKKINSTSFEVYFNIIVDGGLTYPFNATIKINNQSFTTGAVIEFFDDEPLQTVLGTTNAVNNFNLINTWSDKQVPKWNDTNNKFEPSNIFPTINNNTGLVLTSNATDEPVYKNIVSLTTAYDSTNPYRQTNAESVIITAENVLNTVSIKTVPNDSITRLFLIVINIFVNDGLTTSESGIYDVKSYITIAGTAYCYNENNPGENGSLNHTRTITMTANVPIVCTGQEILLNVTYQGAVNSFTKFDYTYSVHAIDMANPVTLI